MIRLTDQQLAALALDVGFVLSTAFGQDADQRTPVTDVATLRTFLEVAQAECRLQDAPACGEVEQLEAVREVGFWAVFSRIS